ncbi:MAG: helix-turn-helix transcriptional regulator [Sandaracinaceae bacterium]|nr:helix-turn-helix transcriptional regulator [Sandaracinaceae bacterium]
MVRRDGRRFTPSARTAANALVSQVEDGLAAARALESIGDACAYLLARPCGAVEQASRGVERWMSRERDAIVRSAIRAADRGELVECRIDGVSLRFARLDGAGGARYLATLVDMPSPRLSRAATLTPVEHSIATSAAAGLSVREIADEHQLSPNTIKTHLKSVYRKLEVASRMELAAMLKDD